MFVFDPAGFSSSFPKCRFQTVAFCVSHPRAVTSAGTIPYLQSPEWLRATWVSSKFATLTTLVATTIWGIAAAYGLHVSNGDLRGADN